MPDGLRIELEGLGKRYRLEWIFKGLDYHFEQGQHYAILGHNGSGKSTLLQVLSGYLSPSKGQLRFFWKDKALTLDQLYRYVSYTGPYMELIEEFSLREMLDFQQQFVPFVGNKTTKEVFSLLQLPKSAINKPIKYYSSGMQQRLKVGLAVLADKPLILLDEPTITLDAAGHRWYQELIEQFIDTQRLLIVASNVPSDYAICEKQLNILDYK